MGNEAKRDRLPSYDDECPTLVARFDVEAYARATATWEEDDADAQDDVESGIRRKLPTLTREIGQLPNEPEEDAIVRTLGGPARVLDVCAAADAIAAYNLEPAQASVLALVDGARSVSAIVDASALPRLTTLRAIEELVLLAIVG